LRAGEPLGAFQPARPLGAAAAAAAALRRCRGDWPKLGELLGAVAEVVVPKAQWALRAQPLLVAWRL